MNVAKWLLSVLLALPLMELLVFIAVSALIGFGWAFWAGIGWLRGRFSHFAPLQR